MTDSLPRRFRLTRDEDPTGVTGTGTVAEGVVWTTGAATVRWFGDHSSLVHWWTVDDALAIHGHDGRTRLVWID